MPAACGNCAWGNLYFAVVLAALASASLYGCTEEPDNHGLSVNAAPAVAEPSHPGALQSTRAPITAAHSRARPPAQRTARRMARVDPGIPKVDPDRLVGLDPAGVGRMLGRPAGTRMDAMAMEWTYSAPSCSLRIFFYPDVVTGGLRALKYNVTGGATGHGCVDFPMMARNDESD